MPSRRSHSNSHHGCKQCKARRVKCDENRPVCTRCVKRKDKCTYDSFGLSYVSPPSTMVLGKQMSLNTDGVSPWHLLPNATHQDRKLLYHFVSSMHSASGDASVQRNFMKWHSCISLYLMDYDYLLHAVLSVAALHMGVHQAGDRSDFVQTAIHHQNEALSRFRPVLENINAQNCEVALAFSGLTIMNAFALPRLFMLNDNFQVDLLDDLTQIVQLFKGSTALYKMGLMAELKTNLIPSILHSVRTAREEPVPDAEGSLQRIKMELITTIDDEETRETYAHVSTRLGKLMRKNAARENRLNFILHWPGMLLPLYVDGLQRKEPIALLIWAHWVVVFHQGISYTWWAREWGPQMLRSILSLLSPEWHDYLDWPLSQIGLSTPTEILPHESFNLQEYIVES